MAIGSTPSFHTDYITHFVLKKGGGAFWYLEKSDTVANFGYRLLGTYQIKC
jgi:hypothetical protein